MYNLIYNEKEIKKYFNNILPPLDDYEVYYMFLLARNKYLSNEEREKFNLSKKEMISGKIIKVNKYENFIKTVRSYETIEGSYLDKNGLSIPSSCLGVYVNINPSNMLKSINSFQNEMNNYIFELSKNTDDIKNKIKNAHEKFLSFVYSSKGIKTWIDIDIDIFKGSETMFEISRFIDSIKRKKAKGFLIDTKSGFHILVSKKSLTFDLNKDLLDFKKVFANDVDRNIDDYLKTNKNIEIKINENGAIPLPGTLQGGYPVRIIEEF